MAELGKRQRKEGGEGTKRVLRLTRWGLEPICIAWKPLDISVPSLYPTAIKSDSLRAHTGMVCLRISQVILTKSLD